MWDGLLQPECSWGYFRQREALRAPQPQQPLLWQQVNQVQSDGTAGRWARSGCTHLRRLAMRLAKAGKPCLGAQGLPLWCQTSVVSCPASPMGLTCSCLAPSCEGKAACRDGDSGSPSAGGTPLSHPTGVAHTALIHKSSSPGWLCALLTSVALVRRRLVAFLDIPRMMSTASSPDSIRPSWESLQTT